MGFLLLPVSKFPGELNGLKVTYLAPRNYEANCYENSRRNFLGQKMPL